MSRRRLRRRTDKARRHVPPAPTAASTARIREATDVERLSYTRSQAATALGVSRSTFDRRVLPLIATVETPWGTQLVPADELQRLLVEWRRPQRTPKPAPKRERAHAPRETIEFVRAERDAGKSLRQIAAALNEQRVPTVRGGVCWWPSAVRSVLATAANP
jgi:hypothetical protein